jgi:hypothetical protein
MFTCVNTVRRNIDQKIVLHLVILVRIVIRTIILSGYVTNAKIYMKLAVRQSS